MKAQVLAAMAALALAAACTEEPTAPATPTAETPAGAEGRFVTFAPGLGMNCALLVTRVYGLRHLGDMQPDGERLRDGDGQAWTPLDLAALVRDERFLQGLAGVERLQYRQIVVALADALGGATQHS